VSGGCIGESQRAEEMSATVPDRFSAPVQPVLSDAGFGASSPLDPSCA
jgi:hypothetical protein